MRVLKCGFGSFFFFLSFRPPGCSCDDVRSAAPRSLVDPRDFEGDGYERTEHNLEKRSAHVGDQSFAGILFSTFKL